MSLIQSAMDIDLTVRLVDDGLAVDFRNQMMPVMLKPTDTLLIHREGRQIIFEVRTTPVV